MRGGHFKKLLEKQEWVLVMLLLLAGAALRLAWLGTLPWGLNQDEASAGYEAWALLNYGMDRNGDSWPVLFKSWGSGQNVLYSYLTIPFVAVMGLNALSIRMVSALAGTVALIVFWLLARRCRGKAFGLTALFTLAVNPWHIMAGRWALESNLLPLLLLMGIYFAVVSVEKPAALIFSALSLALSLYAYGTAFLFLPGFLIAALFWLWRWNGLKIWSFTISLALFAVIALPITACQIINMTGAEGISVLGITIPRLTVPRQAMTTVLGGDASKAIENYKNFLLMLLTGRDGLPFNSMQGFGLFYFFGLFLALLGLIVGVGTRRDNPGETLIAAALVVSFGVSFFVDVNINRMNMVILPIIYYSSLGMFVILRKLKSFAAIPLFTVVTCASLFFTTYYNNFKIEGVKQYFPGLGEAIQYAWAKEPESIFITNYVNQPYIFAMFYTKTPPEEYLSTVQYVNQGEAFERVSNYGRFSFGAASEAQAGIKILHEGEADGATQLERFGSYVVCR